MYEPLPSEEEAAEAGFVPEDYAGEPVDVWPENWQAYILFLFMQTQWTPGTMGPVGLRYDIMWKKMDRMSLDPDEYDQLEDDIRTMELAALRAMAGGKRSEPEADVSQ